MTIPKLKRRLGALLYHTVAKHLPPSYSSLKLGQTALRRFCGRWMLADCGKRVNIEKNATFSAKVTLGDDSVIGNLWYLPHWPLCDDGDGCHDYHKKSLF